MELDFRKWASNLIDLKANVMASKIVIDCHRFCSNCRLKFEVGINVLSVPAIIDRIKSPSKELLVFPSYRSISLSLVSFSMLEVNSLEIVHSEIHLNCMTRRSVETALRREGNKEPK